ncbi:MAG: zinc ABC transporter substrate-binding protein [Planctomycetia bacterium]|nr:zinc ABC transporter substrate-binding protein [Planctomycetia bacterium]
MIIKNLIKVLFIILFGFLVLLIGVKLFQNPNSTNQNRPSVLVTVEPIAYLVEQIAGDSFKVNVLIPAGKEPETFAPNPSTVSQLIKNCPLFFRVGLITEESLLSKLETLAPTMKVVDLRNGLLLSDIHDSYSVKEPPYSQTDHSSQTNHSHFGEQKRKHSDHDITSKMGEQFEKETELPKADRQLTSMDHSNHSCGSGGLDPHIWMSPDFVRKMIPVIIAELSRLIPQKADEFASRGQQFDQELEKLQTTIKDQLKNLKYRNLFVFHPAYGYYCKEFNLEQYAIENEGKSPKPQELADFIHLAKQEEVQTIIIQPEFNQASAKTIADAVQAKLEIHSPLERNYFDNLNRLTQLIVESF